MSNKDVENMSNKAVENMDSEVVQPKTGTESKPVASEVAQPQSDLFLEKLEVSVTGNIESEVTQPKTNIESKPMASEVMQPQSDLFLDKLEGNTMHCTARSTIAHNFVKLKEGVVYSRKDFFVQPNKDEYRVIKDDALMLEFDGATTMQKAYVKSGGFVRYPFQLEKIDDIQVANNKYLIDKLYLSSTSSTLILDDPEILELMQFKEEIRAYQLEHYIRAGPQPLHAKHSTWK
ncbi:hypothetical protein Tco_1306806 [Tanacetum coccineum]